MRAGTHNCKCREPTIQSKIDATRERRVTRHWYGPMAIVSEPDDGPIVGMTIEAHVLKEIIKSSDFGKGVRAYVDSKSTTPRAGRSDAQPVAGAETESRKLPAKSETDILTFMKACAEGRAEDYRGFLVRGSGIAAERGFEGDSLSATLLVCGRSPDGTYTLVERTGKDGVKGVNFVEDRLLKVQLVWEKLPPGISSGMEFVFDADKAQGICDRFKARFEGDYHEVISRTNDGQGTKESVPILMWETADPP